MYQVGFYKTIDEDRIAEEVQKKGFDPVHIFAFIVFVYTPISN